MKSSGNGLLVEECPDDNILAALGDAGTLGRKGARGKGGVLAGARQHAPPGRWRRPAPHA